MTRRRNVPGATSTTSLGVIPNRFVFPVARSDGVVSGPRAGTEPPTDPDQHQPDECHPEPSHQSRPQGFGFSAGGYGSLVSANRLSPHDFRFHTHFDHRDGHHHQPE